MKRKRFSWIDLVALVALLYVVATRGPMWFSQWQMEGQPVAAAELQDLEGHSVGFPQALEVGAAQKRNSILVFWATWCGPCEVELSRLRDAAKEGKLDPSRIFTISVGEDAATVRKAVEERKYPFPAFLDPTGRFAQSFHVEATPTIAFLDKDSKVEWVTSGLSPSLIMRARRHLAAEN